MLHHIICLLQEDLCLSSPCTNGSTCVYRDNGIGYGCLCPVGVTGCEVNVVPVDPQALTQMQVIFIVGESVGLSCLLVVCKPL